MTRSSQVGIIDGNIRLWDTTTGKRIRTLEGHTEGINSVVFSPDGKTLASGSEDDTLRVWDVHTGETQNDLLWT